MISPFFLNRDPVSLNQNVFPAAERLLPLLTEEEMCVFRRGRNAKVNSVPQKADISQYHAATGLEALFGWLYLQGKTERINQLFAECVEEHDGA